MAIVVAAFFVGRATAPSEAPRRQTPELSQCDNGSQVRIVMADGTVGYSESCRWRSEMARIVTGHDPAPIEIYAEPDDRSVVAWYYFDCGLPDGLVQVSVAHPEDCGLTKDQPRGDEKAL